MVDGAATYELQEGQEDNPESFTEIYSGDTDSHELMTKMTGSYSYQVRACDASGACSEWSDAITVNVFTASAPTLMLSDETRATDGSYRSRDGTYILRWNSLGEGITYKLREGDDTELTLTPPIATTHSVTTAKMNGSYNYYVQACHTNGVCSDWSSDPLTVHVFTAGAPTLTLTLTSTETRATDGTYGSADGIYTLRWAPVTDAATYELQEVMSESNTPLSLTPDDVRNPTHMISDKTDGSYRYRLRACHSNGVCSPWSNTLILSVSINDCAGRSLQTSGFHGGDGSSADPYLICDYPQLAKMRVNSVVTNPLTKHYKLGAHIDASDSYSAGTRRMGAGDGCDAYVPTADPGDTGHPNENATCTGWTPVGTSATNAFTGSLQGAGYEIRNLYISIKTTTTRVGLFGETGNASAIQNLGVTNAYIQVDVTSSRVGVLVGQNTGSISNSYATGSITGSASSSRVGVLVGLNNGSISNSYATGSVTGGSSARVGGLVGLNGNGGSLSNSYATGSVTNSGIISYAGGLVGYNAGSISNSYATGSVTNNGSFSDVGGLVGQNTGSISNSYAAGSITNSDSDSKVGGLVGLNSGSISGSYAAGSITNSDSDSKVGGLVGQNTGSVRGKNYFVASDGTNGIGDGSCNATVCIHAGEDGQSDDDRRMWLHALDESAAAPAGMGWLPANWSNFTGPGYPKLKLRR